MKTIAKLRDRARHDRTAGSRRAIAAFASREQGTIAVSAGIVLVPLVLVAAVAIDFAEMYRARENYQTAADAATLHVAKLITTGTKVDVATASGEAMFNRNMENIGYSEATITFDTQSTCTSDPVVANVVAAHPVFFDQIHNMFGQRKSFYEGERAGYVQRASDGPKRNGKGGFKRFRMDLQSEVKCANDTLEIALVMDNSGSMRWGGRMTTMKVAAKDLVEDIHTAMKDSPKKDAVRFALVPFSGSVNVGPNNAAKDWMDGDGISPVHHQDLDWAHWPEGASQNANGGWVDDQNRPLTRFTLFDTIQTKSGGDVEWAGCVQMRPYPHHTRDTEPKSAEPATLFVPAFAPDEPDNLSGQFYQSRTNVPTNPYCVRWYNGWQRYYCNVWSDGFVAYWWQPHPTQGYANRYGGDYAANGTYIGSSGGSAIVTSNRTIDEIEYGINDDWQAENKPYGYNYLSDANNMPTDLCDGLITHEDCAGKDKGLWQGQHRRHRWAHKYYKASMTHDGEGPNSECSTQPVTPLTASKQTVKNGINAMQPTRFTNVTMGVGWGWRALSAAEPFSEGRKKEDRENRKIMIVLTDGKHELPNKTTPSQSYYGGFGLGVHHNSPQDGFMFAGYDGKPNPGFVSENFTDAMDEHMGETCDNVKDDDITVYTIAFKVPNGSNMKAVMENCASFENGPGSPKHYYNADSNQALLAAFKSITESIQSLRISK